MRGKFVCPGRDTAVLGRGQRKSPGPQSGAWLMAYDSGLMQELLA